MGDGTNNMSNRRVFADSETRWGSNHNEPLNQFEQRLLNIYCKNTNARILEAGCGGGRISEHLREKGFTHIDAYDFVEQFIDNARCRGSSVNYFVADASDLSMLSSGVYDFLIYLQRVICFVPLDRIDDALKESYRVCKDGGMAVFSFLNYDGRYVNRPASAALTALRKLRHEELSPRQLPWLRLKGKPNFRFLEKGQATNYWFTQDEARSRLTQAGYEVRELFTSSGHPKTQGSIIYVVCHKPEGRADG